MFKRKRCAFVLDGHCCAEFFKLGIMIRKKSRTYYSILNVIISFGLETVYLATAFIERSVFIRVLGEEFLGLSGVFSSFLAFLGLADLGLASVFTYSLYSPLASKDYDRVSILIQSYKKFYRILCCAVLCIGLLISPIAIGSINGLSITGTDSLKYYLLILINSACSYLGVYKSTLFKADQHAYVANFAHIFGNVVCSLAQVICLMTTESYLLYLLIRIALTLISNGLLTLFASSSYPDVKRNVDGALDDDTKRYFISSLKSLFVYKVSTTILNNSTNIIMSLMLGTVVVGLYSNYTMVTNAITVFTGLINTALIGSIGNLGATSTPAKKKSVFFKLITLYSLVSVFCTTCLYLNISDFILVWLRNPEYVLDDAPVFCYLLYFFFNSLVAPLWMTREANGLFSRIYKIMISRAIICILSSVLLSKIIGLPGIFLGSLLGLITTNMWYEPRMLCNEVFFCKMRDFLKVLFVSLIKAGIVFVLSILFFSRLGSSIFWMIIKCMLVGAVAVLVYSRDIISILRRDY